VAFMLLAPCHVSVAITWGVLFGILAVSCEAKPVVKKDELVTHRCECGLVMDRYLIAAINIFEIGYILFPNDHAFRGSSHQKTTRKPTRLSRRASSNFAWFKRKIKAQQMHS